MTAGHEFPPHRELPPPVREDVDLLLRAAERMRSQHGPDHPRHDFWQALAHALSRIAWTGSMDLEYLWRIGNQEIIAAARAYLKEGE